VTETALPEGVQVTGPWQDRSGRAYDTVLTGEALSLLAALHRELEPRRRELLQARASRRAAGRPLGFDQDTEDVRAGDWRVAEPAPGLVDRRVEITGPTDRKMTVNALNSGAKVWLADFEDANTPLWENMVGGQLALADALDRKIDFKAGAKEYTLRDDADLATIVVRPRGLHLPEKHVLVDGEPVAGALFDAALYLANGTDRQRRRGLGPYLYLPKLEHHAEARLWNDAFLIAQDRLGVPAGTVRATVLIETLPAAFCMDEILYELREHSAGLNAGRWDYLFSLIKTQRGRDMVLPDRNAVTMTAPFMRAYTELLVRTCHRRGAHAIGGMAAFIPNRLDPQVTEKALTKVREDKRREAGAGFDGSWVAHPGLVAVCREEFDRVLRDRPNQLTRLRDDVSVTADDLLDVSATSGEITADGVRGDVAVGLRYLYTWLGGNGAVAIFNLMEDAATAEICRSQLWQWIHHGVRTADGTTVDRPLVERTLAEEVDRLRAAAGDSLDEDRLKQATALFAEVTLVDEPPEFLTLPAYDRMP
jgi:malate synthase